MNVLLTTVVLGIGVAADPVASNTWPGFRGDGTGLSAARQLPVRWSPAEIAWKANLPGYGQSSPVVWKDQVFVTAVEGEQRDKGYLAALDAKTGKEKWRHTFEPTLKAKWGSFISRASGTPLVDASAVYAFFEGGNLLALSHEGKLLWERSLVKDFGEFQNGHGLGTSPAQTENAVIVLVDHRGPSYLLAVDKKNGKTLWKTERPARSSWTSPVVARRDGKDLVIVSSNGSVAAYDAATGKLLWEHEGLAGNTLPSACVVGERVLFGAGLNERMPVKPEVANRSNGCLKLTSAEGKPAFEVLWTGKKGIASYASPLAHRGRAYFVNEVGVVHCYDLDTGKLHFAERIDGQCWASPIAVGDHVYFFGKNGTTTVLKAADSFSKVAANELWKAEAQPEAEEPKDKEQGGRYTKLDPVVYGAAAIDGAIFVRTGTNLYRIGKP
ncbi:MAG: PQQ-binding-like beta-propeller repeat protein [Gemmataceae bacterium]